MSIITSRNVSGDRAAKLVRGALLVGVSTLATATLTAPAHAQDGANATTVQPDSAPPVATGVPGTGPDAPGAATGTGDVDAGDEIVVTGIRASLERAIAIKRNSSGVVDAISAEDIGKFPDTNLAESLQRIPGVSIDRRNGEGSQVTVRGFGPTFNLVTVNGRQLATSDVNTVGGDGNVDFGRATSRSFDFQNLASEGVSRLEVYKTGRSAIPSGGIGAAINVVTQRPLDGNKDGLRGSIGGKALYDTTVEGFKVNPEVSGVATWSDAEDRFGISVFGSYQKRDSTSASITSNDWNIASFSAMPGRGPSTVITNAPSSPDALVAVPNDSRYHFSDYSRERINGQLSLQFRPIETLTLTADGLFAQNRISEARLDQTNWFSRPFDSVTFDDNPVPTAILIEEGSGYANKDIGFEQQYRATKSQLESYGLNASWELVDGLTLNLDGNRSTSKSTPDASNGASSTLIGLGANVVDRHSVDYRGTIPLQNWTLNDTGAGYNGNGVLDIGDLGSTIGRTNASRQDHRIDQVRADLGWEFEGGGRFDVGATLVDSKMTSARIQTQQTLGDWGITNPGDVQRIAGDMLEQFCLQCKFDRYEPTNAEVAFRGNGVDIYNALSSFYAGQGNAIGITGNDFDQVKEKIWSGYAQLTWKGDMMGRPVSVVAGARYENTKVTSNSIVAQPDRIEWDSDNDFSRQIGSAVVPLTLRGEYNNLLPAIDFQIEPMDNVVARVSYSKTLARPDYNNLFASQSANTPNRPTVLGGVATGSSGNPNLRPLVSDNFDISLEWYYKPSSYVSAGFFVKKVKNFVGTGQVVQNLFGLRDPSSGTAGTRSGAALGELGRLGATVSDVSLFTLTALIDKYNGDLAAASAEFQANAPGGIIDNDYANVILGAQDVIANATDPLFNFSVATPINNRSGNINGFELQGQHFFGETGFGVSASYTKVNGDVNVDVTADPNTDVFALLGLSDSFNVTGIYDRNGISARVAYNWRDKFLTQTNRGNNRNPVFVAPFGTMDVNVSYDLTENIAVSLEAINVLSEPVRTYGRAENQIFFAQELKPRYLLGARYRF